MPEFVITSPEQAQELANKVRAGENGGLTPSEREAAVRAIEEYTDDIQTTEAPERQQEKLNFFQRMGENIEKRQLMLTDIMEATHNGEQTYAEGVLQTAGKYGAGLVMDFLGEAIVSGGRGLAFVTPDAVKDTATDAGHAFLETEIAQQGLEAARKGAEAYSTWAEENPRAARNVEAVVNIAVLAAPVKSKPKGSKSIGHSKLADRLRLSADKTEWKRRENFVADLVSPKRTKAVRESEVLRASESKFLKIQRPAPTPGEVDAAKAVMGVPGVSAKKSLVGNARAVKEEIAKEGAKLEKALKANEVIYSKNELKQALMAARDRLSKNSAVIGDAQKAADDLIETTLEKIGKKQTINIAGGNRGKLSDVFKVRKEIDQDFIRAGRPPSAYAQLGTAENGQAVALREIRNTLNEFVAAKSKASVRPSLARQSALYKALDNIVPKAASEATSTMGRIWNRAIKILPYRGAANQLAALGIGVGGLGAGAIIGPLMSKALAGGAAGYLTYKGLTAPTSRRALATLLDGLKQAQKLPGLTAGQIRQIRADRAYIMDLLKDSDDIVPHLLTPDEAKLVENDDDKEKLEQQEQKAPE